MYIEPISYILSYTQIYTDTHKNIFKIANETSGPLHLYTGFLTFNWHQYNFPSFYPLTSSEYPSFLIRVHVSRIGAILQLRKRRFFTPHTQIVTKYDHTTYRTKWVFPEPVQSPYFLYALETHTHIYIFIYLPHVYFKQGQTYLIRTYFIYYAKIKKYNLRVLK